jgi:site-specific DNA-cytosine methylase
MLKRGYRVEARVLDAQWLGVPQMRQRVIFVAVREDLGLAPPFPKPFAYRYSVRDALPSLGRVDHDTSNWYRKPSCQDEPAPPITKPRQQLLLPGRGRERLQRPRRPERRRSNADRSGRPVALTMERGGSGFSERQVSVENPAPTVTARPGTGAPVITMRASPNGFARKALDPGEPMPAIMASGAAQQRAEVEGDISGYAIGEEWDKLRPGEQSDRYFQLVKADPAEPAPTITAAGGEASLAGVTHPTERRKFTIAELRRLCAFPDDFHLAGTYAQQWERLGNSVPPLMMMAIAGEIRDRVLIPVREAALAGGRPWRGWRSPARAAAIPAPGEAPAAAEMPLGEPRAPAAARSDAPPEGSPPRSTNARRRRVRRHREAQLQRPPPAEDRRRREPEGRRHGRGGQDDAPAGEATGELRRVRLAQRVIKVVRVVGAAPACAAPRRSTRS